MSANNAHKANILAVIGATGSGKSVFVKTQILKKSDQRLWIWDFKREYQGFADLVTDSLKAAVMEISKPKFRVAFRPSFDDAIRAKQFDVFCKAAWHAKNCKVLVEELGMVTTPQRSPAGWKMLTTTGRSEGCSIIGVSQRPAQIDKDFFSNCSEIHSGLLSDENDINTMRKVLGVSFADIQGLKELEFIHKNVRTKEINRGKVRYQNTA